MRVELEASLSSKTKIRMPPLPGKWGVADSPYGACHLGWCRRGICHLEFPDQETGDPGATFPMVDGWTRDDPGARSLAAEIFEGGRTRTVTVYPKNGFSPCAPLPRVRNRRIRVYVTGTEFQVAAWRALLGIPKGEVRTYSQIAEEIGRPRAARAVGTACAANPVAYLVPCHRVIHRNGQIHGYRWGEERKRAILLREEAKISPGSE